MQPLHSAVNNSGAEVAEILIRSGADVNARDKVRAALFAINPIFLVIWCGYVLLMLYTYVVLVIVDESRFVL